MKSIKYSFFSLKEGKFSLIQPHRKGNIEIKNQMNGEIKLYSAICNFGFSIMHWQIIFTCHGKCMVFSGSTAIVT